MRRSNPNRVPKFQSCAPRLAALRLCGLVAIVGVAVALNAVSYAQSDPPPPDLPGFGGQSIKPRVLVILDTSRSMRWNPEETIEYPTQDYIKDVTQDADCLSKFCIGKRAMYGVLSGNGDLIEVGLGGYFQYNRVTHHPAVPGNFGITCTYDVLAKAGMTIDTTKQKYSTSATDPDPGNADGHVFSCTPESISGGPLSSYGCTSVVPHTQCTKTSTDGTYKYLFDNPACLDGASPSACTPTSPLTGNGFLGTGTWFYNSTNSKWDTNTSVFSAPANVTTGKKILAGPLTSTTTLCNSLASYSTGITNKTGTGYPSDCTATNPCSYFIDTTVGTGPNDYGAALYANGTKTVYHSVTVPWTDTGTGTVYDASSGVSTVTARVTVASSAVNCSSPGFTLDPYKGTFYNTISGSPDCTKAPYCRLSSPSGPTGAGGTAADTQTAYNPNMTVSGYTKNAGSSTTNITYKVNYDKTCAGPTSTYTSSTYTDPNSISGAITLSCGNSYTAWPGPCEGLTTTSANNTTTPTAYNNSMSVPNYTLQPGTTTTSFSYSISPSASCTHSSGTTWTCSADTCDGVAGVGCGSSTTTFSGTRCTLQETADTLTAATNTAYTKSVNVAGMAYDNNPGTPQVFTYTIPQSASCDHNPGDTFTLATSTYSPAITGVNPSSLTVGCGANNTSFPGKCDLVQGPTTYNTTNPIGYNDSLVPLNPGFAIVSATPSAEDTFTYDVAFPGTCEFASGTGFKWTQDSYQGVTVGCGGSSVFPGKGWCDLVAGASVKDSDAGVYHCSFTRKTYSYTGAATKTCSFSRYSYTYTGSSSRTCNFIRTTYNYSGYADKTCTVKRTRYTYTKPAAPASYYCSYKLDKYTLTHNDKYCRFRRYNHAYSTRTYSVSWLTEGGEIIDTATKTATGLPSQQCSTTFDSSVVSPQCPDVILPTDTGAPSQCTGANVDRCKLRWTGTAVTGYGRGRFSNSPTQPPPEPTQPVMCMASDRLATAPGSTSQYWSSWCASTGGTGSTAAYDDSVLVADYYDITAPYPLASGDTSYSPALSGTKNFGLSYMVPTSGSPQTGTKAVAFTPIAANTAVPGTPVDSNDHTGEALAMLQKYNATTNPTGLRMPTEGDFTPLYGSLTNAKQYIQALQATDSGAACRPYYVLLVTDGNEQQGSGPAYSPTDLAGVVTDLAHAGAQTFVVGFGVSSSALDGMAKAGGHPVDSKGTPVPPTASDAHAYNAADSDALSQQLNAIFGQITSGYFSRSKPVVTNDGMRIYAGYFEHSKNGVEWPGHLDAYPIDKGVLSATPLWKFDQVINSSALPSGFRQIMTHVTGGSGLTNFDQFASSPNCQLVQDILGNADCSSASQALSDKVINFVRNDRGTVTFNNGTQRLSRLGDIFHSTPVAIGAPIFTASWGDGTAEQAAYSAFKTALSAREPTVYVASNDGLIHAIRDSYAASPGFALGSERWAYVPHGVLDKLPQTLNHHTFTADGSFALSDVCTNCTSASGWKTVLVGSLGHGGSGLFALDVTDPTTPVFLWDFDSEPNMGDTWSAPVIARVKVGTEFKWAAFVGGGYSTEAGRGDQFYAFDVFTGSILTDGSSFAKTQIGNVNRPSVKNNLPSRARVFRPNDASIASVVYVADTDAKISRLDVSSGNLGAWTPAVMFNPFGTINSVPVNPLTDETSTVSATTLPLAAPTGPTPWPAFYNRPILDTDNSAGGTSRNLLFIGTGDPNNPEDTNSQEYFFAVRDDFDVTPAPPIRAPALWAKKLGLGEKVLSDPVVYGRNVVVAVYKPPVTQSVCGSGGSSTLYCFDKTTGTPANCLTPDSTAGNPSPAQVSYLTVGTPGILSDLTIVGGSLVFSSSSAPNVLSKIPVNPGSNAFRVHTWNRIH